MLQNRIECAFNAHLGASVKGPFEIIDRAFRVHSMVIQTLAYSLATKTACTKVNGQSNGDAHVSSINNIHL